MVDNTNTAEALKSGTLPVFATPSMIALIEETALLSVADYLKDGEATVGTKLDVSHVAATPIGMKVTCETELIEVDRRRLVFNAKVYDEVGLVGEGTHERFVIDSEKFLAKANNKISK
ncbi:thioesterase family protein [Peptoniphilus sp.]|uniref:thioesterase family protein n=1 Tax=Peptoniphilus sp. TaxID=1971214 RepID=UPI003D8BC64E